MSTLHETYQECIQRHADELRANGHTVRVWMVALNSGYPMYIVRRVLPDEVAS